MRVSNESYQKMNAIMAECFNANAIIDNLCYNLDYQYFNEIGAIMHQHVAHKMPEWADQISEKLLELSARPVRKDINGYSEEYKTLIEICDVLHATLFSILEHTKELISIADMNSDDEIRIFGEDFLEEVSVYVKQAEEWQNAAKVLTAHDFNIHVNKYTHYIEI